MVRVVLSVRVVSWSGTHARDRLHTGEYRTCISCNRFVAVDSTNGSEMDSRNGKQLEKWQHFKIACKVLSPTQF